MLSPDGGGNSSSFGLRVILTVHSWSYFSSGQKQMLKSDAISQERHAYEIAEAQSMV